MLATVVATPSARRFWRRARAALAVSTASRSRSSPRSRSGSPRPIWSVGIPAGREVLRGGRGWRPSSSSERFRCMRRSVTRVGGAAQTSERVCAACCSPRLIALAFWMYGRCTRRARRARAGRRASLVVFGALGLGWLAPLAPATPGASGVAGDEVRWEPWSPDAVASGGRGPHRLTGLHRARCARARRTRSSCSPRASCAIILRRTRSPPARRLTNRDPRITRARALALGRAVQPHLGARPRRTDRPPEL